MSDDDDAFINSLRKRGGQTDAGQGMGAHPFRDALKGVGHGMADLAYGAGQALFPEAPDANANVLNPMTAINKYAPGVKQYVEEPEKLDAEGVAREATDILGPMAIPGGGEVEEGVNLAAKGIRYGQKLPWGRAAGLGKKALERTEKYVAPIAKGAYQGFMGGSVQPTKSGDQTTGGEVGAGAGAARAAFGTLPWQARYGLPGLAILYEEMQRATGGRGSIGSPYGLWHIPSALSALAGLVSPSSAGAAGAQLTNKYGGDQSEGDRKLPF